MLLQAFQVCLQGSCSPTALVLSAQHTVTQHQCLEVQHTHMPCSPPHPHSPSGHSDSLMPIWQLRQQVHHPIRALTPGSIKCRQNSTYTGIQCVISGSSNDSTTNMHASVQYGVLWHQQACRSTACLRCKAVPMHLNRTALQHMLHATPVFVERQPHLVPCPVHVVPVQGSNIVWLEHCCCSDASVTRLVTAAGFEKCCNSWLCVWQGHCVCR